MFKAWPKAIPGVLLCLLTSVSTAFADSPVSVICSSPTAIAPTGGGSTLIDVLCTVNAPDATAAYRITGSANNFMAPASVYLSRLLRVVTATLEPTVDSPDNNITSISGTSSGFTASLSNTSQPQTLRFRYRVTTNDSLPSGIYTSLLNPAYYRYRICTNPACSQQEYTGTASTNLQVRITSAPTTVSCASEPVTAPAGGGMFQTSMTCTISGTSPDALSPSSQNMFSPSTITFTGNNNNINASLLPGVTSPDSSVTGISGTAGGGFTGAINVLPATVQARYQGMTTVSTRAGTYTSTPVVFVWSAL